MRRRRSELFARLTERRDPHLSRINHASVVFSFSSTALQLIYTIILFASVPNNCVTGVAAGEKDTFVLG